MKKNKKIYWISKFQPKIISFCFLLIALISSFGTAQKVSAQVLKCDDLSQPDKQTGVLITILEEQIGPSDITKNYTVINCYRKTVCERINGKDECKPPVYAQTCQGGTTNEGKPDQVTTYCQPIQAYIADSGPGMLFAYVGQIYRWSASIIGIVTVLYLIIGGIEIATAGGDSGKIEKAKERVMQSILGLVLLFLSALLLYTINPNFFTL